MSNNYTMFELKEFLRARNLPTSGSKAELITRLEQFDGNIWKNLHGMQETSPDEAIEEAESVTGYPEDRPGRCNNELPPEGSGPREVDSAQYPHIFPYGN
ncbi:hypothetical protein ANTQUA_LOCUS759 [Anthophora quadrimaculata]